MEHEFRVVMANHELLAEISANARKEDIDELWASNMITPNTALSFGYRTSTTFVLMAGDTPLCAFGITPYSALGSFGAPWMIGTNDLERHAVPFIRKCRRDLKGYFAEWNRLFNFVDARNTKAIRWLKWLGFTILPVESHGPFKMPFHPFIMEVKNV